MVLQHSALYYDGNMSRCRPVLCVEEEAPAMSTLIQASCYRQHRKLCALPRCKDRVQITKHQSTVLTQIPHISNDPSWQGFERGETRAAIAKQGRLLTWQWQPPFRLKRLLEIQALNRLQSQARSVLQTVTTKVHRTCTCHYFLEVRMIP